MNKRFALLAPLALVACGGGSDSTSAVPVTTGGTPTPTATATPTPTPAAYTPYLQLTGDQSFRTACAALSYDFSPPLPVPVIAFGKGLTLSTSVAGQSWTLTPDPRDTGLFGTQARTYGPAERDASVTTALSYTRTTNGFIERFTVGSNTAGGATPDYVRGFSSRVPLYGQTTPNPPAAQYQCIFGVPTRGDDVPAAGVASSRTGLNGTVFAVPPGGAPESYAVTQSTVGLFFDGTRVTTTVHLVGQLVTATGTSTATVDLGTYTGTATVDRANGYYSGQLTSADRMTRDATFAGWFFGPQAGEAAFSMGLGSIDQATGRQVAFIGNALALR